ncbi:hypothetical protein A143_07125 [Vibrio splendidus ZS-139]|nr:hypothetical protein A143_07125 [Vibrio splendidus ZS-139]
MKSWYDEAYTSLIEEIEVSTSNRIDGAKFIRNYVDKYGLALDEDEDEDEIETQINQSIDDFEEWLTSKKTNEILVGRNYFWSKAAVNKPEVRTDAIDELQPRQFDYTVELDIVNKPIDEINDEEAKKLLLASSTAIGNSEPEKAFIFSENYLFFLKRIGATDSEKLEVLDIIIRACDSENGSQRADKYKFICEKAEIYTKQYEHSKAASEYKLAITQLEKESVIGTGNNQNVVKSRVNNLESILKSIYQKCRVQYQNAGMTVEASDIYVKECKHIQKNLPAGIKRSFMWILWLLARYGESPRRVAGWGAVVILGFAVVYMATGINPPSGLAEFICVGTSGDLVCKESSDSSYLRPGYLTHLYYSVVTFTTLGYGDFSPVEGASRAISAIQALLGLILTSLFLGTFIKKYSR